MPQFRPIDAVVSALSGALLLSILVSLGACKRKGYHERSECYANLRQVHGAWAQFLIDHGKPVTKVSTNQGGTMEYGALPRYAYMHFRTIIAYTVVKPESPIPYEKLLCPLDSRLPAPLNRMTNENLSYFISVNPQMERDDWILSGTRNLYIQKHGRDEFGWDQNIGLHGTDGFLLFADGSACKCDGIAVSKFFERTGNQTNQLAIP